MRSSVGPLGPNSRRMAIIPAIMALVASSTAWSTPQYFPGTGNYYDVIFVPAGLSWSSARAAAESQVWQGAHGYLACITSLEENQFTFQLSLGSGAWWNDPTIWAIGPWLGGYQLPGSPEPDEGWSWISGEPWIYSSWFQRQPDNNGWNGWNEDRLCFWGYTGQPAATWNDYTDDRPVGPVRGYVVEFSGEPPSAVGACCFPAGVCLQGTPLACQMAGGIYVGDGTSCEPDPCAPVPVEPSTWGRLKASYH
jgi:hypothetical protein